MSIVRYASSDSLGTASLCSQGSTGETLRQRVSEREKVGDRMTVGGGVMKLHSVSCAFCAGL